MTKDTLVRNSAGVRWLAVAVWMGLIFYFSHQSGQESAGLSSGVVQAITTVAPNASPDIIHTVIRKLAHVSEYAVLGALVGWTLPACTLVRAWAGLAIGVGYAITDEVHQLFIPGRSGEVGDVVIDGVGVAIGVGLMLFAHIRGYIGCYVRHNGHVHRSRGVIRQKQ